ncbi:MAG: peptidoglycan-binding protein [Myxococcales bacterium]|nr:peptidoglycan-binding protein [Myxococcales bacterium]
MKVNSNPPTPRPVNRKLGAPTPANITPPAAAPSTFAADGQINNPATTNLSPQTPASIAPSIQRDLTGGGQVTGGLAQTPTTGAPRARSAASTGASRFTAPNTVLRSGAKGANVTKLQQRLKELGYDPGPIDGSFGPKTDAAVKAFQRKSGLSQDGVVGPKTWSALEKAGAPAPAAPAAPAAPGFKAPNVTLKQGASGQHVKTLQSRLKDLGFNPGSADGSFGPKTSGAVKSFQKAAGLGQDGVVGPKTWKALEKGSARPSAPAPAPAAPKFNAPNVTLKQGASGQHVKTLQNRLKDLGFNPGGVDGKFGPGTAKAVRNFQWAAGLGQDGVVGPKTWSALEKGKSAIKNHGTPPSNANVPGLGATQNTTGYVNGRARNIQVAKVEGKLAEVDTAKAYLRMKQAAARDGVHLQINSGFRTMEQQRYLYNGWINRKPGFNPAAKPGYSNHQSGVALDLNTQGVSRSQGTGKVYNWLAKNAHKYGFKRIPIEHWHWEYQPGLAKYR